MLYATLFCGLVVAWLYARYRRMTVLKRGNIPGPPPNFLFGNSAEFAAKGMKTCFKEWTEKYGPVVGFYIGGHANVVVTDLELLRNIQNKDFHLFSSRYKLIKGGVHPTSIGQQAVVWRTGDDWKQSRLAMARMFSAAKLKMFVNTIKNNVPTLYRIFDKESNGLKDEFDVVACYRKMTFYNMVETQFSFKVDLEKHSYLEDALSEASNPVIKGVMPTLLILFPELDFLVYPVRRVCEEILEYFLMTPESIIFDLGRRTLNQRKKTELPGNDMLQLMLKLKKSKVINNDNLEMKLEEDVTEKTENDESGSKFTDDEIVNNLFIFFLAGYETTASTLSYMTHNLTNIPEMQDKLRREVRQLMDQDGVLDYNTVNELPLLEAFMKESLRMYPPLAPFVNRTSDTNYKYKDMTIPAGAGFYAGVNQLHYDERYWPEPNKFDPERFMGKQKVQPIAYQPFGGGPRNCVGMRFAILQIKLVMAQLLLKYEFTAGPTTEIGVLTTHEKFSVMLPTHGVKVKLIELE
ncbi:Thromboxane-A synthase [Halotydeus destructor]|nr:Thromboxane-A synthase [Halotydeus destructor]